MPDPIPPPALAVTLAPAGDPARLAPRWAAMHARAGGSFFQSWTWLGCRWEERFDDAVLLEAREDGHVVAMGLFNRAGGRFGRRACLGETGDPAADSVFTEHNGLLVDHPARGPVLAACLRAALRAGIGRRLVLSGVDDAHADAARQVGAVRLRASRPAPFLDLARARETGGVLAQFSANTRYQLRRAQRAYEADGKVRIERAGTEAEALAWLAALAALHQTSWRARGRPGAFAEPAFVNFHRSLVARSAAGARTDLLRVSAGPAVIGYLYNFAAAGRVSAYQSGFDYAAAGASSHRKPGLVCHKLAMELYAAEGFGCYDFLAGADRYKRSLSHAAQALHWLELAPSRSVEGLAFRARAAAARLRRPVAAP
jgi:CelD/BcsL family acetyltransferase involved in cellulose biosynthesis